MNTQTSAHINASLLALELADYFLVAFKDIPAPVLADFLELLSSDSFGTIGNYSFYCKNCGKNWNFEKKIYRQIFQRFHHYTKCSFVWHKNERDKHGNDLHENYPYHLVRTDKNVPAHLEDFIKTLVKKIRTDEPVTRVMQSESAV